MNILVIDDSEVARSMIEATLADYGHRVIGMGSPIGATRMVVREKIDVVVLDLQMPDVRGDRIAALFRQGARTQKVGVVLISGAAYEELAALGESCGADAVVTKEEMKQVLPHAVTTAYRSRRLR